MSASDPCLQLATPAGVSIVLDLPEGRGLVSARKYSKGSEIIEELPFCHIVKSERHQEVCASCLFSPESELLRCSNCKYNHYCSKACQRKDWPVHKGECVGMATSVHFPPDCIRLMLRLMMKKKEHFGKKPRADSLWPVDLLCEQEKLLPESTRQAYDTQIFTVMMMCANNKHIQVEDTRELFSTLHRLVYNTFFILNIDMHIVGEGLYVLSSFINHSCDPNCTFVFDGLKMSVRSIEDIKPGQQLYISYANLLDHPSKRQETLRETYFFTCHCRRCSLESFLDPLMTSALCTQCGNILLSKPVEVPSSLGVGLCTCGKSAEGDTASIKRTSEEFDGLSREYCANNKDMLKNLLALESRVDQVLSPYHNLTFQIKEKIMGLALDLCEKETAFRVGCSLVPLYQLYMESTPVYTAYLVEVVMLSRELRERKPNVPELCRKLVKNIEITHGPSHSLYASVQLMVQSTMAQHVVKN